VPWFSKTKRHGNLLHRGGLPESVAGMSTSEHVINLIVGAAAGAGGVYFQRKGKRYFYLYVLFWVVALAMVIAAWYWISR
jgi:hypothetical protein